MILQEKRVVLVNHDGLRNARILHFPMVVRRLRRVDTRLRPDASSRRVGRSRRDG